MDAQVRIVFNKIVSSEVLISANLNRSLVLLRHSKTFFTKFSSLNISNPKNSLSAIPLATVVSVSNGSDKDSDDPFFRRTSIQFSIFPGICSHYPRSCSHTLRFKCSDLPVSSPTQLGFLLSLAVSTIFPASAAEDRLNAAVPGSKDRLFVWHRACVDVNGSHLGNFDDNGVSMAVVLLGWLGAEHRHLRRYAELYTSRGIHALAFVVPVKDVLGFKLGSRVEKRIEELARELVSWLSGGEKDGRERCLLFHTFSNTGWLAYGAVLQNLQSRIDLIGKIKGCVVDSGGDMEINPQVWASGFSAALLKNRCSSTISSFESNKGNTLDSDGGRLQIQNNNPPLIETAFLTILEKFFSVILRLPHVNEKLCRIISILSKNQPDCPQLYLYSTADRVIPAKSIERFIQEQKKSGKQVRAYNFWSSPHVDHFRTFPHIYSTELYNFLKECTSTVLR